MTTDTSAQAPASARASSAAQTARRRVHMLAASAALAALVVWDVTRGATPLAVLHAAGAVAALALAWRAEAGARLTAWAAFWIALAIVGALSPSLFGYPARVGVRVTLGLWVDLAHVWIGAWGAFAAHEKNTT